MRELHPAAPTASSDAAAAKPLPPFWIFPALSVGLAVVLGGGLVWYLRSHLPQEQPNATAVAHITDGEGRPGELLPALTVPEFAFTERSGRTVSRAELLGKVWVADFIFTHCGGTCPIMTSSLNTVQESCRDLPDLRLVSITVDPERDTPERLRMYADSQGADPERWLWLTGEKAALYRFAREAFRLAVGEGNTDPETAIGEEFIHSSRLVLIDAEGRVAGMYSGTDKASVEALIAELRLRLPAAAVSPAPTAPLPSVPSIAPSSQPQAAPTPAPAR